MSQPHHPHWNCATVLKSSSLSSPILSLQDFQETLRVRETIQQDDTKNHPFGGNQQQEPIESQQEINNNNNTTLKKNHKKPADPNWFLRYIPSLTRTWHPQSLSNWCVPETDPPTPWTLQRGEETAKGLLYIKSYKTGSSTCEGIAWNIAHHVGRRLFPNNNNHNHIICKAYTRHEFANLRHHAHKDPNHQALLWSFVRHPAKRDLSHVFHFSIGREGRLFDANTTVGIYQYIENKIKGRQTRYLVPQKTSRAPLWPRNELRKNRTHMVQYFKTNILDYYEFLGVTERMEESLAVMVLLWDLQPKDVIVLDSKKSGGYDDGGYNETCKKIPKAQLTPELEEYFASRHKMWNADYLLYYAVNASLDRTIEELGRDRVETMVKRIRSLQTLAVDQCLSQADFPCTADGVYQPEKAEKSCYVQDAGCGHACIDRVLENA